MPQRKSFWMYDYDQVKYRTPVQWFTLLVLSFVFGVFGCAVLWAVWSDYESKRELDFGLAAAGAAFLGMAIIELPASALFFYRRWRGEITGYFDYEILHDPENRKSGVDHGSDHR